MAWASHKRARLCAVDEVDDGTARRFDVVRDGIALVRIGEHFYAIGDRCSHANVSLCEGDVHVEDCSLECWKHGSTFSLTTGEALCLPATRPVPVYPVEVVDGAVWVEI